MGWTERELRDLPVKKGFRMRGMEMTRLETFVDAAFTVVAATGLISAVAVQVFPAHIAILAGFVYATLGVSMPVISSLYARKARRAAADCAG